MIATLEHRFRPVNRLAKSAEWLTDRGSPYVFDDTKRFRGQHRFHPSHHPISSPQSNGTGEAFVPKRARNLMIASSPAFSAGACTVGR